MDRYKCFYKTYFIRINFSNKKIIKKELGNISVGCLFGNLKHLKYLKENLFYNRFYFMFNKTINYLLKCDYFFDYSFRNFDLSISEKFVRFIDFIFSNKNLKYKINIHKHLKIFIKKKIKEFYINYSNKKINEYLNTNRLFLYLLKLYLDNNYNIYSEIIQYKNFILFFKIKTFSLQEHYYSFSLKNIDIKKKK